MSAPDSIRSRVASIDPPRLAIPTVRPDTSATAFTGSASDEIRKNGDNCAMVAMEVSGASLLTRDTM